MKLLNIPQPLLRQCFERGTQGYPEEVCGVLTGPESDPLSVTAAHPLANIQTQLHAEDPQRYPRTAREGYVLDPKEHMLLERKLGREGQAIRVIYHSHVDVGAYFSQEDTRRALWDGQPLFPGVGYLVCGIRVARWRRIARLIPGMGNLVCGIKNRQPDGAVIAWFDEAKGTFTEIRLLAPGTGVA